MAYIATLDPAASFATVLVVLAAFYDLKTGRVPNSLNLFVLVAGLGIGGVFLGPAAAFLGLGLGIVIGTAVYLGGRVGGGDAKLLFGLGALLGPLVLLEAVCWAFMIGAAWTMVRVLHERQAMSLVRELRLLGLAIMTPGASLSFQPPQISVRFAPFIALGVIAVSWWPQAQFLSG